QGHEGGGRGDGRRRGGDGGRRRRDGRGGRAVRARREDDPRLDRRRRVPGVHRGQAVPVARADRLTIEQIRSTKFEIRKKNGLEGVSAFGFRISSLGFAPVRGQRGGSHDGEAEAARGAGGALAPLPRLQGDGLQEGRRGPPLRL